MVSETMTERTGPPPMAPKSTLLMLAQEYSPHIAQEFGVCRDDGSRRSLRGSQVPAY